MKIQINYQGREFVNEVSKVLHNMIGSEHRITSVYHPQSNGLCGRQNRTIKDSLVKVLDGNPCDWPNVIEGVLFAWRISKRTSKKCSTFFLVYNREPTLPINVKYSLVDIEGNEGEHPFDKEMFDALLLTAISKKNNSVIKIDTIKCLPQVTQVQWVPFEGILGLRWNNIYVWWKAPSQCYRQTTTRYRESRSSKFNG